ncbi:MAG: DUF948 domain-containing protein [Pseudonocardiaceae bacterium]|nr:DUF948 domain-containing protein [Pseudonocardiaceae bacterium]
MSAGQIAAIVAAAAFVLLVLLLAIPLIKLGRTLDEATTAIRKAHEGSGPLLSGANTTITSVNTQLERLDGITAHARSVSGNVSALTSLFTATLGGPLVRAAALSYGVGKAVRRRRKTSKAADKANRKADKAAEKRRDKRRVGGRR